MGLIYWSVCSFSKRGGDEVKRMDRGIVIITSNMFHFIRVHDNLAYDPSNNKSILYFITYFYN